MSEALLPIVIFVHGTWSSPKIWKEMENHLKARLPLVCESIGWSGGNSAAARTKGMATFKETIEKYAVQNRPIFVICHSHGANIVLEVNKTIRDRINLLLCLNSPILTTIKNKLPWPIWLLYIFLTIFALACGVGFSLGIASESPIAGISVLALVALSFWAANSQWAFLLFVLFGIAAAYPLHGLIRLPPAYDPTIPWLVITAAALFLIPVLTIYAFWARRYAIGINPQSVKQLTHIVAIDDEIFTILGIALAVQRVIQFAIWPIKRLFEISLIWILGSIALMMMDGIGFFLPSVKVFENRYFPYVGFPLVVSVAIAAALIFAKVVLFGIAYGWDMAGLSMNHSIYVSPGSFAQKTELYTIEPDASWDVWISHIKIHEREETFAVVATFIEKAIEEAKV